LIKNISKLKRDVSTDPLGTVCRFLGICGAHLGNHCLRILTIVGMGEE